MPNDPHTRLKPEGGTTEVSQREDSVRRAVIDAAQPFPKKPRDRFDLPVWLLGRLEILGQSRIELGHTVGWSPQKLTTWSINDPDAIWSIIHSVHASSRIENEGIHADQVPALFHAVTKTQGQATDELDQRMQAERDITLAYQWALNEARLPILSVDFLLELHRRMFSNSRAKIAGQFKTKPVIIADDEKKHYDVTTLPPAKAEEFLSALCERINGAFHSADRYAGHSKLIATAEFLVDFLAIHPFQDGNGRTARLLSTYLLERFGYHFARFYPLDQVVLDSRNEYFRALFLAQEHWYQENEDINPWLEYYINAVFKQYERAFAEIRDKSVRHEGPVG